MMKIVFPANKSDLMMMEHGSGIWNSIIVFVGYNSLLNIISGTVLNLAQDVLQNAKDFSHKCSRKLKPYRKKRCLLC